MKDNCAMKRRRANSQRLREKVRAQNTKIRLLYFIQRRTISTIAKIMKLSIRTIKRSLSELRKNSMKVVGLKPNPSWAPKYTLEQLRYLQTISSNEEATALTAKQRLELMNKAFPLQPLSIHTIRRMLKKLDFKRKQLKPIPKKMNELINKYHRILVVNKLLQLLVSGKQMISFDEAVIDGSWLPFQGYSLRNHRALVQKETNKKSIYLMMAISQDGIFAYQVSRKPFDTITFTTFFITLLFQVHASQALFDENYFIFLDNLPVHKSAQTLQIMSNLNIMMLFNAPYTVSSFN